MKIDKSSSLFKSHHIAAIEEHYSAKYVCETCVKNKMGNWINQPMALFWTEKAHPEGSNYFVIYWGGMDANTLMVSNGITALDEPIQGVLASDGVVYYSKYRHDFRNIPGGFIDGGRDYLRRGGDVCDYPIVNMVIEGPNLIVSTTTIDGEVIPDPLQLEHRSEAA